MWANLFRPTESLGQQPVLTVPPVQFVTEYNRLVKNCFSQVLRMSHTDFCHGG
jgi:hypothetical protein